MHAEKILKNCEQIEAITLPKLEKVIKEKLEAKEKIIRENGVFKSDLTNLKVKEEMRIKLEYKEEIKKLNALQKVVESINLNFVSIIYEMNYMT